MDQKIVTVNFDFWHKRLAVLALLVSMLALPFIGFAEEVAYAGAMLKVDELRTVDSSNVHLRLLGESRIVERASVGRVVATTYLQKAPGSLSEEVLRNLIQGSLEVGDLDLAVNGYRVWLARQKPSMDDDVRNFTTTLLSVRNSLQFARELLQQSQTMSSYPKTVVLLIAHVGVIDPTWVQSRTVRHVIGARDLLRQELEQQIFAVLSAGSGHRAVALLKLYAGVFGLDDKRYQELLILVSKTEDAFEALRTEDWPKLAISMNRLRENTTVTPVLAATFAQNIGKASREALDKGNAAFALELLSLIDSRWRTPMLHEILEDALREFEAASETILENDLVLSFARDVAEKDTAVYTELLGALEREFNYLLGQHNFNSAMEYLERITLVRPDVSSENDRLRARAAVALGLAGAADRAEQLLGHDMSRLSFIEHLQLMFAGVFLQKYLFIISSSILLLALSLYIPGRFLGFGKHKVKAFAKPLTWGVCNNWRTCFITTTALNRRNPKVCEYIKALEELGVSRKASGVEIKKHYRNRVKVEHPDVNFRQSEHQRTEFVKLTTAYEQVVRLRRELGLKDA